MPIVFFRRQANRVETKGAIDTVLFEPEAERFCVVWRASLPLRHDIFEVPQVVVGRHTPLPGHPEKVSEAGKGPEPSVVA